MYNLDILEKKVYYKFEKKLLYSCVGKKICYTGCLKERKLNEIL